MQAKHEFSLFDPNTDPATKLPCLPGCYIVVLRPSACLPEVGVNPTLSPFIYENQTFSVVYVGISSKSLRGRDYKQHFMGNNAGRSTLRKSIGSLMGYSKIPRDSNNIANGKTKFTAEDEAQLTSWMRKNLLLFYRVSLVGADLEAEETELIARYNPPLNLSKTSLFVINSEYRDLLSTLRSKP